MTLTELDALFDRLNPDEQLLLIDHLADQMEWGDELLDGLQTVAWRLTGMNADEADALIPQGKPWGTVWKAHAKKRDASLDGALRLRALGNGRRLVT